MAQAKSYQAKIYVGVLLMSLKFSIYKKPDKSDSICGNIGLFVFVLFANNEI